MSMIGTATNSSPYLAAPAAATIENGKNHFVTLGENGVSLATEGAAAAGILLPDTEDKVAGGESVTVQIKDRTLVQVGAAVTAGDPLASDANGCAVKAAAEKFIVGYAMESATAADQIIHIQITKSGFVPKAG